MNAEPPEATTGPAKTTRTTRPYRSPRRAKSATATREAILAAATKLFRERSYGKVTVSDIAEAASTAVPTVYASTGGKSAILATLVDQARCDPIVDTTLVAVQGCRDPEDVVRTTAHGTRVHNERYNDMIQVMFDAATIDDTATSTLVESNRHYRQALGHTADRLATLKALRFGLGTSRAIDILWFYLGHQAWQLCVADRGWTWNEAEEWLATQASTALLVEPRA
jgi:AcrR family transcriptional regulator